MADTFALNLGSLRSRMSITLHTHHASRLWMGRRPQADKSAHGIIGMPRFISLMDNMKSAAASNDPYADHWLIRMEEKLEAARQAMRVLAAHVDEQLSKIPPGISIADNLNIQPLSLPLFINCQLGYIGVYLLTEFDTLARRILLANHTALLGRRQMEKWLDRGAREIRSVYGLAQQYRHAGVTREDMSIGNARAREAIEKFGELPADVLDGSRRSSLAPPLPQHHGPHMEDADNEHSDDLEPGEQ